jgi:hypothetical protein
MAALVSLVFESTILVAQFSSDCLLLKSEGHPLKHQMGLPPAMVTPQQCFVFQFGPHFLNETFLKGSFNDATTMW